MIKGGAVSKHCSILNYIRHADNELYELIQDLCIGRMFVPRRGSTGLTFLRPSKSLLAKIKKEAEGDNPENAISMLQSMILLDHLPSISDFDDKKDDIPNFLRKKLLIKKVGSNEVTLTNDSTIKVDKDFMARADRNNIAVYILDGEPSASSEASEFKNTNKKTKKGGAELFDELDRTTVFVQILKKMFLSESKSESKKTDAAAELILELVTWAEKNEENKDIAELIKSQVSHDSLASLAIILQPYKSGNKYISDDQLKSFSSSVYGTDRKAFISYPIYSRDMAIKSKYDELITQNKHSCCDSIEQCRSNLFNEAAKPTIVKSLLTTLNKIKEGDLPKLRKNLSSTEMLAEAELRVLSAIILDNSSGNPEFSEVEKLFSSCTLDKPYMCGNQEAINSSNVGYYYSTVYLMARSDALCYVPGLEYGGLLQDIAKEDKCISLSESVKEYYAQKREESQNLIATFCNFLNK
jgi:hypothetical protein